MKAAICFASLAILAGVISAAPPFGWQPDTDYTYRVQSRFAAGLLGIDGPNVEDTETDRALVELIWRVDIYRYGNDRIYMMPRDFKAVIAKEKVHPREEPISSQKEVAIPQKYQDLLQKTMAVKLNPKTGAPDSIVVYADQPLSAQEKNLKRAQVNAFILNTGTSDLVLKGNVNRQTNSARLSEQDDDSGFFYKAMEESIHGECQTYYHVSQTGPFQSMYQLEAQDVPVQDDDNSSPDSSEYQQQRNPRFRHQQQQQQQQHRRQQQHTEWQQSRRNQYENEVNDDAQQQPWPQAFQEFCDDNDQVYIIQKTVNLTACKDRPVLATMMPSELLNCRPGDNACGSLWNHVVHTRYVACGQSREVFTIIEVNQEERFVYGLRSDENIDGFAVKNVTLELKKPVSGVSPDADMKKQGSQPYEIKSLVYEFDLAQQQKQFGSQPAPEQQQWQQKQQQQQQARWQKQQPHWQQQSSQSQHHHNQQSSSSSEEDAPQGQNGPITFPLRNHQPSLEQPPLRPRLITPIVSEQQLKERALDLVQEAAHNIMDPNKSIPEGETIALQSVLAKTIRYMSKQQIKELYEEALERNHHDKELQATVQNILTDAICAAGTNPALVAMMELIEEEQINDVKAAQLVMTFPHYARHPTKQFLQRFRQFAKNSHVQNSYQVYTTAHLALSTLYYEACVNARIKQAAYSYALYGPWCQPEDAEEFAVYALNALDKALDKSEKEFKKQGRSKSHEVSLHLAVLGNLGSTKLPKAVQKVLDASNDVQEKSKAIFALKHLVRSHEENNPVQDRHGNVDEEENQNEVDRVETDPIDDEFVEKKVLPLLMSVALDRSEHPTVRCAAIQMLLYCTYADMTVYQQLAYSTWTEPSEEVHYFIATTMNSLAELEVPPTRQHWQMIVKARSVLPMMRPLPEDNYAKSGNYFSSGTVEHLNSQFFYQVSWLASKDSKYPTSIYFRDYINFGSGALGVNPIEIAAHFRTLQQNIIDKVREQFGSSSSEESGEKNQYMKQILDKIVPREMKEKPHGAVYLNLRNGMQRLWTLDEDSLDFNNQPFIIALRRGVPFNYQKTIQLAHHTMEMPTILGVPMSFKLRLPGMVSLRGKAKLNGDRSNSQFHAEIDAVAGFKRHAKISLKIPFIQRKIESGLQSHFVVQAPIRITYRARSDEPLVFAITPIPEINGTRATGKIELATFHRQPYIAVITDELYPSVHPKGGQMTVIRTVDPPTTNENHNQDILGFSFTTQEVSDYREEKETPEGWARYFANFGDVESFAHLGSFGGPLAKYASRKLILNIDESQSKTLVFVLAAKRGQGSLDQGFDTDVSSSSSSSSSTSESDSSDSSDSSDEESNRRARQNDQSSDSSSSSSSSSETNEASNSNEDSAEVLRKGRLIVVAVLTKKKEIPPVGRTTGLINMLKTEYPNQQQYIFQLSKRTDKFFLRYAQGSAAEDAARSLPTNSNSVAKLAQAVIDPDYQGQQADFCTEVNAKIQYPKFAHPRLIVALRDTLLNNELSVEVQASAQYAHTCKDEDLKENEFTLTGQLQRGPNMTEWARSKSPEAQQCEEDEKEGFSVSDDCLTVAIEQASALNRAYFNLQWPDNLPEPFQQFVYDTRDAAKYWYYPHVTHDRFPDNPTNGNQARIELQMSPDGEYWSASVLTNETELQFNNVPSCDLVQAALPPSAIQSIAQNMEDSLFGSDSQPTCQLEGKKISSFDDVVDEIQPEVAQNCYHLLTADGSGEDSMAIYAKNIGTDNMKLLLVLSQTTIQVATQRSVPRARLTQVQPANEIAAIVNSQVVSLPYTVRKQGQRGESNDYVARIQPHPSGGVQILTPKNDIAFDGSKVIIFVDDSYRNKTVGMCGDFDGEKVADRRSLKDIPLSNATLLYANYAFGNVKNFETDCKVDSAIREQIQNEHAIAKIQRNHRPSSHQYQQSYGTQQQRQQQQQQQQQQMRSGYSHNYNQHQNQNNRYNNNNNNNNYNRH